MLGESSTWLSQCFVVVELPTGVYAIRPPCFRLLCRPRSEVGDPFSEERAKRTMRRKITDEATKPSVGGKQRSNQEFLLDVIGRANKKEATRRKHEKRESEIRARRLSSSSPNPYTTKQATDGGLPLPVRQAPFEPTAEVPAKIRNVLTPKQPAGRERSTTPNAARVQDAPPSPYTVRHLQKLNVASPAAVSGSVRHGVPLGSPKTFSRCNPALVFLDSPPAPYSGANSGPSPVAKLSRPNGPLSRTIARNGNKATAGIPQVPNSQSAEGKGPKGDTPKAGGVGALHTVGSPVRRRAPVRTPSPVMKGDPSSTTTTQSRRGNSPGAKGGKQNGTTVAGISHSEVADISSTSTSNGVRNTAFRRRDRRKYGGYGASLVGTHYRGDDGEGRWVILWHHP